MKKQTKTTPSVVSTPAAPVIAGGFTIGLDLGDRNHYVCVLDATGQAIHEGLLPNSRVVLALLLTQYPSAVVALEAGTHSPWISRYLRVRLKIASSWSAPAERSGDGAIVQAKRQRINKDFRAGQSGVALRLPPQSMTLRFIRHALTGIGATVIIANPRKLHAIPRPDPEKPKPLLIKKTLQMDADFVGRPVRRRRRREAGALTRWAPDSFWKNPDPIMNRPARRVRMEA